MKMKEKKENNSNCWSSVTIDVSPNLKAKITLVVLLETMKKFLIFY